MVPGGATGTHLRKYNLGDNASFAILGGLRDEQQDTGAARHGGGDGGALRRLRHTGNAGQRGEQRRAGRDARGTRPGAGARAAIVDPRRERRRRQGGAGEAQRLLRVRQGGDHRRGQKARRGARRLSARACGAQGGDRGQRRRARQRRIQRRARTAARRRRVEDHDAARRSVGAHRDGELGQGEAESGRSQRDLLVREPAQRHRLPLSGTSARPALPNRAEGQVENWSAQEDDRPYIRPARSFNPWFAVAAIAVIAWLGAFYFRYWLEPALAPAAKSAAEPLGDRPAPPPAAEPAIRHPLETPVEPVASLPTLENSDSLMRQSVAGLIGGKAFADLVMPDALVRRIVATVDNLPQRTAPRRVMPLNAVPGSFGAAGSDPEMTLDPANFARYLPYVNVVE